MRIKFRMKNQRMRKLFLLCDRYFAFSFFSFLTDFKQGKVTQFDVMYIYFLMCVEP